MNEEYEHGDYNEVPQRDKEVEDWLNYKKCAAPEQKKMFDFAKALQGCCIKTRCGYPARLVATDLKGDMPLLALVDEGTRQVAIQYTKEGRLVNDKAVSSNYDLVTYERRYLNVFRRGNKYFCGKKSYASLEMAREMDGYIIQKVRGSVHVATIEIEEA